VTDPPTLRRRFLVMLALRWFQAGLQVPVLILLLRARGLDLTSVGVVFAVYGLTTAVFELPTGGLADVLGRRQVLIAAALLFVVESLAFGLGQEFAVLVAAAALGGLGRALDSGPLEAWFVDSVHQAANGLDLEADLARAKAVEAAALGLGALAGGGLVAVVALPTRDATVVDLSVPFLVSAGICLGMVAAIFRWVHEPTRGQRPSLGGVARGVPATIWSGLRLAVGRGPLRRITILMGTMGVALSTVELLAPASLARILGGEDAAAGPYAVAVTVGFFGSAAGSSKASAVARMLGSPSRGIMAARVLGACALLSVATSSFAVAAVAILAFYALNGIARPLISDILHRSVSSSQRATILSVESLTLQLSGVVAALAIGAVAQHISLGAAFAIGAGVLMVGATACISMPDQRKPRTKDRDLAAHPDVERSPPDVMQSD
jgi:MFS family permease